MSSASIASYDDIYSPLFEGKHNRMAEETTTKGINDIRVYSNMSSLCQTLKLQAEKIDSKLRRDNYIAVLQVDNKAWNDINDARGDGRISKSNRFFFMMMLRKSSLSR
jgi:hypothetical protein